MAEKLIELGGNRVWASRLLSSWRELLKAASQRGKAIELD